MTKYKSKIGIGLAIFLLIVLGGSTVLMIYQKIWSGFFMNLLVIVFVVHLFLNTYYVIGENILRIKCGFLFNKSIDIKTINKISETNNPISAPAVSFDRLELHYNKLNSVLVSPKNKNGFIGHLKKLNTDIEVVMSC